MITIIIIIIIIIIILSPLSIELGSPARTPLRHEQNYLTKLFFSRDKMPINSERAGVFPGMMCSVRRKNHGCGQKKKMEGTSFAISGFGTAKCCELKRRADPVR